MKKLIAATILLAFSASAYASNSCDNPDGLPVTPLKIHSSYKASNEGTVMTVIYCEMAGTGYEGAPAVSLKSGECTVQTDNYSPILVSCDPQ